MSSDSATSFDGATSSDGSNVSVCDATLNMISGMDIFASSLDPFSEAMGNSFTSLDGVFGMDMVVDHLDVSYINNILPLSYF